MTICGSDGVFAFLLLCIVLLNYSCNNACCVFFRTSFAFHFKPYWTNGRVDSHNNHACTLRFKMTISIGQNTRA